MINTKLQNIIDTKSAIGNAIVNKGGTITSETPFFNYAAEIDGISTGSVLTGNATANQVFNGQTFYSNDANTQLTGTYVAPQIDGVDESKMSLVATSPSTRGRIRGIAFSNGLVFAGGQLGTTAGDANSSAITAYFDSNLSESFSNNFGNIIRTISTNNGFVFAGGNRSVISGDDSHTIKKYHASNLVKVAGSQYGINNGTVWATVINNGAIFVGGRWGAIANTNSSAVEKYNENLGGIFQAPAYGNEIYSLAVSDGFVYAGGRTIRQVKKYHESNLVEVGNSVNLGADLFGLAANNGFVYAGGTVLEKLHASNLVSVANVTTSNRAESIIINNGFVYAASGISPITIQKYYESNLGLVGTYNSASNIFTLVINNGFLYSGTDYDGAIQKKTINTSFTNSFNGQAWYLIPKE
jgi:uncharacterized protein YggL (DUF469 family)